MTSSTIVFIGAGNMAYSIIGGLVNNQYPADLIHAVDPNPAQLSKLASAYAVHTHKQIEQPLTADCIVLAVKPQVMQQVIETYHAYFNCDNSLFISIAAGISLQSLQTWLSADAAIVRCMPNTPALVQTGATVLTANAKVDQAQKTLTDKLMTAVGECSWTSDEALMDVITATSGSGPAYFFLLMEQMQAAAEQLGLDPNQARALVAQTALGAAKMAKANNTSFTTLRENVTSKGGTTAAALAVFEEKQFADSVKLAIQAAAERSQAMQKAFE